MENAEQSNGRDNRRNPSRLRHFAGAHMRIAMTALMLVVALGAGMGIDRYLIAGTSAGQQADSFTDVKQFDILDQTYQTIRENYVLSDDITDEQLVYGAAAGMVAALGDTGHSVFLDPEEAKAFDEQSKGELVGIGVQIDTTGNLPKVIAPIPGSPAAKAGILPGDVITEVDGKSLEGMDPSEAGDLLRGEEGTKVKVTLIHAGETEPYEVTLTRSRISVPAVTWAMMPNDVAWIYLSEFSSGATEQLQKALRDAKSHGAKGVVLDMRNNPGGLVFEAIGVASQFLPNNSPLIQEKDKDGNVKITKSVGSNGEWQKGPLVVLINNGSASSAEFVASAIQDNKRGELIGETTFGTGTVLQPFRFNDGSMLLLGVELWLTADGHDIYKKGVSPDTTITNEPGVLNAIPETFGDGSVSDEQVKKLDDKQLTAGYQAVLKEIEAGS